MKKTKENGYDTLTWNGITIRATSDRRIEIDLPGATATITIRATSDRRIEIDLPGATATTVHRLYIQPMEGGINCRDHNGLEEIDLEYAPSRNPFFIRSSLNPE